MIASKKRQCTKRYNWEKNDIIYKWTKAYTSCDVGMLKWYDIPSHTRKIQNNLEACKLKLDLFKIDFFLKMKDKEYLFKCNVFEIIVNLVKSVTIINKGTE